MAAERNFWQVLIVTKCGGGVHTRVLEYPTKELAEETIDACVEADAEQNQVYIDGFRLYPAPEADLQ
jgi:hypothetical protein